MLQGIFFRFAATAANLVRGRSATSLCEKTQTLSGLAMVLRILMVWCLLSSAGCGSPQIALQRTSEEVSIQRGSISLAGTLEIPEGQGPVPAVLLVQGSAAFDRSSFGLFDTVASRLAAAGIASLRMDDRGTGGSGGVKHDLSAADLAADVVAVLDYLARRPETDPGLTGLVGHSFGGALIPTVATQSSDAAFIITLAGYAVTGEALMMDGRRLSETSAGKDPAELERVLELQQSIFEAAKTDGPWDEIGAQHHAARRTEFQGLSEEARARYGGFEAYLAGSYDEAVLGLAKTPWFKSFLSLDPGPHIQTLEIPFLALFGELDSSVPPSQNLAPMTTALSDNPRGITKVIPGVDHFFRVQGDTSEEFLSTVVQWITDQAAG